jgi:hypothetical protein
MDMTCRTFALCLLMGLAASSSARARECAPSVRDGWVRMPPAAMPMMAGFGRIQNDCPAPMMIVGASSPAFASVELHETRVVDGISRMRAVPELRLAPDGAAVLKPGGMHLMLMQPRTPLKAGSKVAIEFELADGRKLLGEFEVRKPAM